MKCYLLEDISSSGFIVSLLRKTLPKCISLLSKSFEFKCSGCCKFIEKHKKCMHYMCANCIDSSKSCQICLQNNNECTYCNVSTKDLILLSCQHSICSLFKNARRDCKKCKLGLCYQCKINKASCDRDCGHNLCQECYKNRPKCEKCFI